MSRRRFLALAGVTALLLVAGVWLSVHRAMTQGKFDGGGLVFADLTPALSQIDSVRLSKGDGSRITLQRAAPGWLVVERHYPADPARVRELLLNLANLKIIEAKTRDPANYSKLGVEAPESPTAGSTLLEVTAGKKSWSLIVGKSAPGRAIYVRQPTEAASALAEPSLTVDPDPKRWIDRLLTDVPGATVHDIAVRPATGAAYVLSRAKRDDPDLELSPIPKGRTTVSSMSLDAQADALQGFNFDDVRAQPAPAVAPTDHAVVRTFDGQVLEFGGHREGEKAYVTLAASRDATLAAQFPAAPGAPPATPDQTVERLAARVKGVEFEIPIYKYEALFRTQEDLLEKLPAPAPQKKR